MGPWRQVRASDPSIHTYAAHPLHLPLHAPDVGGWVRGDFQAGGDLSATNCVLAADGGRPVHVYQDRDMLKMRRASQRPTTALPSLNHLFASTPHDYTQNTQSTHSNVHSRASSCSTRRASSRCVVSRRSWSPRESSTTDRGGKRAAGGVICVVCAMCRYGCVSWDGRQGDG